MVSDDDEFMEENLNNLELATSPIQTKVSNHQEDRRRLLDFLKAYPSPNWIKKFSFSSPETVFRQTVNEREEVSFIVPSPVGIRRHFNIHFIRKIKWASLMSVCKEYMENPMNIALFIWLTCVAVSASMLGLLLLGLLDKAFPTRSSRNHWIEINNQVLNALFTLMSLYQHPKLFHHLFLLCRWSLKDVKELRKMYCKNGTYRPHERAHMTVVLVLLHVTCFAQYASCSLYWGYSRTQRPEFADDVFLAVGIAAPALAGAYTVYSPLGRECDVDLDEESDVSQSANTSLTLYGHRIAVNTPEWIGGLFDCSEDAAVGCFSFFCTFCVFGWNIERLGFGNMYVHIVTFLLLCIAPFWIFNIAALNIRNEVIGDIVGITGVVLCVFGLLYGGFWRIQMRRRFKLPGNTLCCGSASLTDYMQWMFCWACSLAQEVRTGNFYDVEDDSLYRKHAENNEEEIQLMILNSSLNSIGRECASGVEKKDDSEDVSSRLAVYDTMAPPVQPLMDSEDNKIYNEIAIDLLLQGESD